MNMPEEEEGYRCVCDSGYEKKGISCSLIGRSVIIIERLKHYVNIMLMCGCGAVSVGMDVGVGVGVSVGVILLW